MLYATDTMTLRINKRTVFTPNGIQAKDKFYTIKASMATHGWMGRPIIMANCGDHDVAFTGSHRLAAASEIESINIPMVWMPDDLDADAWDMIHDACDDDELLAAFEQIAASRDDMDQIVETMRQEIASN